MKIVEMKVADLIPYERNPRHNDEAVDYVAESIKQFGFNVPIVIDKDNTVVCGHTRLKAAKKLKIKTVPCVVKDDLTDEEIRAYRLADNRSAEKATWDIELLDMELAEIETIDMTLLGFDQSTEIDTFSDYEETKDSQQVFLKWCNNEVPLSEDEISMLDKAFKKHVKDYGTSYGFVREIFDEIH